MLDTRGHWLTRFVYWLPLLQIGLGTMHIPGAALIAPAFAAYVVLRIKNARATALQPALHPA